MNPVFCATAADSRQLRMTRTPWQVPYFHRVVPVVFFAIMAIAGCVPKTVDYIPVTAITRDGFLADPVISADAQGTEITLSGFVDHGNIYGDSVAKRILGEWWSGESPAADAWRFNMKAAADDVVGHSFAVFVANDPGRNDLLRRLAADARAQRPTQVLVCGRLFRFEAPTQVSALTGLYLEVTSSDNIRSQLLEDGVPKDGDDWCCTGDQLQNGCSR